MEPFRSKEVSSFFILALGLLIVGVIFGFFGSIQYAMPGFLKEILSFEKVRPLHVSSVVFWILTAAMAGVMFFIQEHNHKLFKYPQLVHIQFYILSFTFVAILISYLVGIFGGREYWEFHPYFFFPILTAWILFLINILSSVKNLSKQPVYVWMWITGGIFFLFTYLESNLWQISWFRNEIVHDMTIQWKSYGSMVGSWNMLIYGSSIYLMDKISGSQNYSKSNVAFALYFLGLFNGMFNWGHHIYTLPTHAYVKHIAYIVSMTELILLARIIYLWKEALTTAQKHYHILPYKFILAADIWVFITLGLAIAMSVPALNIYMHGTHVVVGHTMGATIGINTMLLFAFVYDYVSHKPTIIKKEKQIKAAYLIIMISLPVFFLSLIIAGFIKGLWQLSDPQPAFGMMMYQLRPYFWIFAISGLVLASGLIMAALPALNSLIKKE